MQTTSHLLMIEPVLFGYNAETAVNNVFQAASREENTQEKALQEFKRLTATLQENDIDITVIKDTPEPHTPDSVFPNNWISFHEDGTVILYPMFAPNRRLERKPMVLYTLQKKFRIYRQINLSHYEKENRFLEGTGSMVLDRENKIAYACLSPRTDISLLNIFCRETGYHPVSFTATDTNGTAIYHTNVMMCIADRYAVICLASVADNREKQFVSNSILNTGKEIIEISLDQLQHFAGNMLQVENSRGEKLLIMSSQAYNSLTKEQCDRLEHYNKIIHSNLSTIETNGGGSARCMLAEIHLPLA